MIRAGRSPWPRRCARRRRRDPDAEQARERGLHGPAGEPPGRRPGPRGPRRSARCRSPTRPGPRRTRPPARRTRRCPTPRPSGRAAWARCAELPERRRRAEPRIRRGRTAVDRPSRRLTDLVERVVEHLAPSRSAIRPRTRMVRPGSMPGMRCRPIQIQGDSLGAVEQLGLAAYAAASCGQNSTLRSLPNTVTS